MNPPGGGESLLALEGIRFRYPGGAEVLSGIDLALGAGELLALLGSSGSGKSTLLAIAGLLATPDSGTVRLSGAEVPRGRRDQERLRNRAIGFVFQHHFLLPDFTVAENVAMPLWIRTGRRDGAALTRASALLEELGIGALTERLPHEISGGERQRVALARAVFPSPGMVLADEPTGSLDSENGAKVLDHLVRIREDHGCGVLLVTHDPQVAARCDRRVTILDGRIQDEA